MNMTPALYLSFDKNQRHGSLKEAKFTRNLITRDDHLHEEIKAGVRELSASFLNRR
jgi:hypothetical protein